MCSIELEDIFQLLKKKLGKTIVKDTRENIYSSKCYRNSGCLLMELKIISEFDVLAHYLG